MKKYIFVFLFLIIPHLCFAAGQNSSGLTAYDLIEDVKDVFNDNTTDPILVNAEIVAWIDYSIKDIIARTHCLQGVTSLGLQSNTIEYSLSAVTYIQIEGVIYRSGASNNYNYQGLAQTDIMSLGHVNQSGPPEYYFEYDHDINIWPVPTSAYSGNSVFVYYSHIGSGVTTTSSAIETPAHFDQFILWYCLGMAYLKDKRYDIAGVFFGKYEQGLDRYRADFVKKPKESLDARKPK